MVDTVRRSILTTSLAIACMPTFLMSGQFTQLSHTNRLLIDEFIFVYKYWMQTFSEEPIDYLQKRGFTNDTSAASIKFLSVEDFRCENTMIIKGLVLSKIEVGVIASIGAQYLNS